MPLEYMDDDNFGVDEDNDGGLPREFVTLLLSLMLSLIPWQISMGVSWHSSKMLPIWTSRHQLRLRVRSRQGNSSEMHVVVNLEFGWIFVR